MAATFFTSDLHFGHQNIIEYCNRPFGSVDEMNFGLVDRWNSVVGSDDEVWVLGDVCMGKVEETLRFVKQLHGTKQLVVGNHDRMFKTKNRQEWEARYRKAGFVSFVYREHQIVAPEGTVKISHFPYTGDSGTKDRFPDHRPVDDGGFLLHGHVHGRWLKKGRMVDVGVDAWGGRPASSTEVFSALSSAEEHIPALLWT